MVMRQEKRKIGMLNAVGGGGGSGRHPSTRASRLLRPLVALGTALAVAYLVIIRLWMLRWGSTEEERARPLLDDDLVPNPTHITTRAITIQAPPREIWSWLVQMGQNRAGFYTHNWVERLLLSGIPDVHEIHPEWQDLSVGDIMRTNRDIRPGYPIGWPVDLIDSDRALVVGTRARASRRADDAAYLVRSRSLPMVADTLPAAAVRAAARLHADRCAPGR